MSRQNGILKGELKATGGKLLKCELTLKKGRITSLKITGDFFLYPEEKITDLETCLLGCRFTTKDVQQKLTIFFHQAELVGATPQDFINLIMLTSKEKKE
jgi:lipoate-protein ligase A